MMVSLLSYTPLSTFNFRKYELYHKKMLVANSKLYMNENNQLNTEISPEKVTEIAPNTDPTINSQPLIIPSSNSNDFNASSSSLDDNGYYISCGSCKSVFLFKNTKELDHAIGTKGSRVKCSVCDKQWFQGVEKVTKIEDNQVSFHPISSQRAEEMKKFILDNNWARNPKGDKIDLFIGNLPFNFDENDISKK